MDGFLSHFQKVRQNGHGRWNACCPAHPDKNPSMSIKQTSDGKILVYCFAGCSARDIVESAGLKMTDLNPNLSLDNLNQYKTRHSQAETDRARLILNMAKTDRARGKRLSASDLETEQKAFQKVRQA